MSITYSVDSTRTEDASTTIIPPGEQYEIDVPDTLDLAERARMSLNCLTGVLDPEFRYEQYFHIHLGSNPPYMWHDTTGRPTNDPKFLEALPYLRVMTGSDLRSEAELGLMQGVLDDIAEDGMFYARCEPRRTWHEGSGHVFRDGEQIRKINEDFANPYGNARLMIAFWIWHQRDGNSKWLRRMEGIANRLGEIAIKKDDYAYFPESRVAEAFSFPKSGWHIEDEPIDQDVDAQTADSNVFMYHGGPIRALTLLYRTNRNASVLETARKLVNFVLKPEFWRTGNEPSFLYEGAGARWHSHFPGHMETFRALLEYGLLTRDQALIDFVRRGYECARQYLPMGIGYVPATFRVRCACSQPRLMALAIMLCDAGIGDYWDDVDRLIRNHVVEIQAIDTEWLQSNVTTAPSHDVHEPQESSAQVIERALGGFLSLGDPTISSPEVKTGGCCNSNGSQGLYYAWESIIRYDNGTATINLLLNRASPWLDIHSHLPNDGKVVIHNKQARRASVRIPAWVQRDEVKAAINGRTINQRWLGRYLLIDDLQPNDVLLIEFPIEERTERHTIVDKEQGSEIVKEYQCTFRGNTLVDIAPRSTDRGYPLYRREHLRRSKAPAKRVNRFVASQLPRWHGGSY